MHKISRLWSSLQMPRSLSISAISAAGAVVLTGLISLCCEQARADEPCGPAEAQYVKKIATGMQMFAPKVTRAGGFAVKKEYPGDTTETVVISFVDHGKTLFVHRITGISALTPTEIRPGKTKGGDPGFLVVLAQGNIGECQYGMFVHDGKFVVVSRGVKWYKR